MAEEEEVMVWRPPLHLALRRILNKEEEDLAVLRLLLTHHADPNRRDLRGRTALEAAIEWGCSQEAVEALREASESAATPVVVRKAGVEDAQGRRTAPEAELAEVVGRGA